jgi:hypothetical protein
MMTYGREPARQLASRGGPAPQIGGPALPPDPPAPMFFVRFQVLDRGMQWLQGVGCSGSRVTYRSSLHLHQRVGCCSGRVEATRVGVPDRPGRSKNCR